MLERLLTAEQPRLFFTQSLAHNPTGSDLSQAKAFRILQLAQKHDVLVVENDPLASDLADLKSLIHVNSSEHAERTVDVILSAGHYQRHLNRQSFGADVFALTPQSLYLWVAFPAPRIH